MCLLITNFPWNPKWTMFANFHINLELRRLAHLRPTLNMDAMKKLVSDFVLSRLEYCNSLFAGLSNDKIIKLQRIQNNAARLVLKQPKRHHLSPLLIDLHWLPIKARIDYKVALLCFKCLNNNAPAYIKDLIVPYTPARMLRSSSSNLLSTPSVSSKKYGERALNIFRTSNLEFSPGEHKVRERSRKV